MATALESPGGGLSGTLSDLTQLAVPEMWQHKVDFEVLDPPWQGLRSTRDQNLMSHHDRHLLMVVRTLFWALCTTEGSRTAESRLCIALGSYILDILPSLVGYVARPV